MSMKVWFTQYGRQAAGLLRERVAEAKRSDPLRPVTVLVPTNAVGVSTRRLLASGRLGPVTPTGAGLAGVTLLTVYRLAELLGAARLAAARRRPVSTPVVAAAARRVLAADPGRFAPVAEHPATERALVRAHRELSEVSSSALDTLAARSPRGAEIVRIHRGMRDVLKDRWYDETDLMGAATEVVHTGSPVLADLGTILVHLPQDLSRPAAALLRAVAEHTPVELVVGLTGAPAADTEVERTLQRIGVVNAPGPTVTPPVASEVVSVSDAEEEVRAAVRRVIDALRHGVPLERIALLYPEPDPYARLAHEHLTAAGIAYNGGAVRPLADRLLGRWLLDLLGLQDGGYRRESVLGLLVTAPARGAPLTRWERISRDAGVVRGRDDWDRRLRRFAERRREEATAESAAEDARDWLAERLRRDAEDAEALRRFVLALVARLDRGAAQGSWSGLVAWARALVDDHLGGESSRGSWPDVERVAAEKVDAALDRLAGLDAIDDAPSVAVFRRTLELELDADLGRVGRLGEGLLVGRLGDALGVDLDVVIVLGCAEGVLPARPREDSLLPDAERAIVARELLPRSDRVHVQHRQLLAALAGASGARILSYPRGDLRRSIERPPSRWLLDTVEVLRAGDPPADRRRLPAHAPWLTTAPSFAGSVARLAFPATRQEYALRSLGGHGLLPDHPLVTADPALRRGVELLRARRSPAFTRFDGNLAALGAAVPSPAATDAAVSPTRLEAWAACPHRYLLEHVLGVHPVENPEELVEISARDSGELIHAALERWLCDALRATAPPPGSEWSAATRAALARLADEWCDRYEERGLTGHPLLWSRDRARLLRDLDRFLTEDTVRRQRHGIRPIAVELGFGVRGATADALRVTLPDGRALRLRGKIDRVDVADDGRLVVTDYKTTSTRRFQGLSADDPDIKGTKLQLPAYALAARATFGHADTPVVAEYWFVSTKGEFRCIGYEVTDAILEHFRGVLEQIVDGIEGGLFPAHPAEPTWRPFVDCDFCDPDGLGTADRYRDWERKRLDPALAGYIALAEPELQT